MSERYGVVNVGHEQVRITDTHGEHVYLNPIASRTSAASVAVIRQLLADLAERDARITDYRDEFSGLCHTLSVGSEGRPEMTASDWRKRVDQGIEFLIRPLQERAERAEAELALAREQIARSDEHHQAAAMAMTENLRAEVTRLAGKLAQLQKESK